MLGLLDFANKWVESGGLVVLPTIIDTPENRRAMPDADPSRWVAPADLAAVMRFLASDAGGEHLPALPWVAATCAVAAIVGDQVGYMIGAKLGPALFKREESRFFHPENVAKAEAFFAKHGSKTIILARFVPIVRTFVPTVAGASKMHYRTFVMFNVIGGLLWGAGVTTLGYFLGEIEVVKENIEIAAIVIVFVSVLPIVLEFWKHRKAKAAAPAVAPTQD